MFKKPLKDKGFLSPLNMKIFDLDKDSIGIIYEKLGLANASRLARTSKAMLQIYSENQEAICRNYLYAQFTFCKFNDEILTPGYAWKSLAEEFKKNYKEMPRYFKLHCKRNILIPYDFLPEAIEKALQEKNIGRFLAIIKYVYETLNCPSIFGSNNHPSLFISDIFEMFQVILDRCIKCNAPLSIIKFVFYVGGDFVKIKSLYPYDAMDSKNNELLEFIIKNIRINLNSTDPVSGRPILDKGALGCMVAAIALDNKKMISELKRLGVNLNHPDIQTFVTCFYSLSKHFKGFLPRLIASIDQFSRSELALSLLNDALDYLLPNIEYIKCLLDSGIDVNIRFHYKSWTPLMKSACLESIDAVALFIERGADKSLKDSQGKTALEIAQQKHPDNKQLHLFLTDNGLSCLPCVKRIRTR